MPQCRDFWSRNFAARISLDLELALNLQKIPVTRAAAKIGEMARLYGSSNSPSGLA
jgi:hypothetical protein